MKRKILIRLNKKKYVQGDNSYNHYLYQKVMRDFERVRRHKVISNIILFMLIMATIARIFFEIDNIYISFLIYLSLGGYFYLIYKIRQLSK